MYIERDAKILLMYYSIYGIVILAGLYLAFAFFQQQTPNPNFPILQLLIFSIIGILTLILIGSIYSVKKEISGQQEYLQNLQKTTTTPTAVKVPYNKSGLYAVIIVTILGIMGFLYLYTIMVLQPPSDSNISLPKDTLQTLSLMIFSVILILVVLLLITLWLLMKRIQTPLYYEYKPCPRCGSTDILKVEYSWWGGLLGPALVHEVRCKKCGMAYDGSSGRNIAQPIKIYFAIGLIIVVIIIILRYFLK
jgi:hypothetical protein